MKAFLLLSFLLLVNLKNFGQNPIAWSMQESNITSQNLFLTLPSFKNTGNGKQDTLNYNLEREKWISNVLSHLKGKITSQQEIIIREKLKTENLEDVMHGKLILTDQ